MCTAYHPAATSHTPSQFLIFQSHGQTSCGTHPACHEIDVTPPRAHPKPQDGHRPRPHEPLVPRSSSTLQPELASISQLVVTSPMSHHALCRQSLVAFTALFGVFLLVLRHQHIQDTSGAVSPLFNTTFSFITQGSTHHPRPRPSIQDHLSSSHPVAANAEAAAPQPPSPPSLTRRRACADHEGFYHGKWVYAPNVSRPHTHMRLKSHAFTRAEVAFRKTYPLEEGWAQHHLPWNQYDFVPHDDQCAVQEWNVTKACLVLDRTMRGRDGGRRVLFVGDSMSFTMALSLVLMMGGDASGRKGERTEGRRNVRDGSEYPFS